ncbi:hypothetical protein D3C81_2194540 [compost metagenome]
MPIRPTIALATDLDHRIDLLDKIRRQFPRRCHAPVVGQVHGLWIVGQHLRDRLLQRLGIELHRR